MYLEVIQPSLKGPAGGGLCEKLLRATCRASASVSAEHPLAGLEAERGKAQPGTAQWTQANDTITVAFDHHTGNKPTVLVHDTKTGKWSEAAICPARRR